MISRKFCQIFKKNFFIEHLQTTASVCLLKKKAKGAIHRCFMKKLLFKNFAEFTEKHPCFSFFLKLMNHEAFW